MINIMYKLLFLTIFGAFFAYAQQDGPCGPPRMRPQETIGKGCPQFPARLPQAFCETIKTQVQIATTVYPFPPQGDKNPTKNMNQTVNIVGTLCIPQNNMNNSIQLLLHGMNYDRRYWNPEMQPEFYSYQRFMYSKGMATIAIDRLGSGESEHLNSADVQVISQIEVSHQIIEKLRSGVFKRKFDRVIVVGHSFGSVITYSHVEKYPNDVDALIMTAMIHEAIVTPEMTAVSRTNSSNIILPSRFGALDPGYMSTCDISDRSIPYAAPYYDETILKYDEQNKGTTTIGEAVFGFNEFVPKIQKYTGPILNILGVTDFIGTTIACATLPCTITPCNLSDIAKNEATHWPNAKYSQKIIADAGHVLNLHCNAQFTYDFIYNWIKLLG